MSGKRYPGEFKIEAIRELAEPGYKVSNASLQLHLVHVVDKQELVSWPLFTLDGPAGTASRSE